MTNRIVDFQIIIISAGNGQNVKLGKRSGMGPRIFYRYDNLKIEHWIIHIPAVSYNNGRKMSIYKKRLNENLSFKIFLLGSKD